MPGGWGGIEPTARGPRLGALAAPLVLVGLSIPLLLWRLGSYSFVNGDEALYQAVAEQMVESGDWRRLEFKSEPRLYDTFMNAPLHYWARAGLIAAFGSNLWTARILSALFGVASVLATWRLAASLADRRSALWAGLVLLTTFQFVYLHSARTGELETVLCFVLVLAAALFLRGVERRGGFLAHHLCLALLVNLKLPVALVPALAELAWFALTPSARGAFGRWLRTGLAVLPFAFLWHAAQLVALRGDGWSVFAAMWGQATGSVAPETSGGALANARYYLSVLLFGAHPWVFAYPPALAWVLGRPGSQVERRRWRLVVLFPLAVLAFYLGVAKHASWYLVPAHPFLAICVGCWLGGLGSRRTGRLELGAIGALVACSLWVGVDVAFNPFAFPAFRLPLELRFPTRLGVSPALGVPLLALALAAALLALRHRLGARAGRPLAIGLGLVLFAIGLARVSAPLRHLGYQSDLARLHQGLEERRAAGLPIAYPVDLPDAPLWLIRYYFADDFRIVLPRESDPHNSRGGLFQLAEPRAGTPLDPGQVPAPR